MALNNAASSMNLRRVILGMRLFFEEFNKLGGEASTGSDSDRVHLIHHPRLLEPYPVATAPGTDLTRHRDAENSTTTHRERRNHNSNASAKVNRPSYKALPTITLSIPN